MTSFMGLSPLWKNQKLGISKMIIKLLKVWGKHTVWVASSVSVGDIERAYEREREKEAVWFVNWGWHF